MAYGRSRRAMTDFGDLSVSRTTLLSENLEVVTRFPRSEMALKAAEAVRESQIRVLKAKRAQVPACDANADRLRAIDEDISSCLRLSVADIIASCRQERAKSAGK